MSGTATQSRLPVITYHSIDLSGSPVSTSPREFERQLDSLSRGGWRTLSTDEALDGHARGFWTSRSFVITFDDGYRSVLDRAVPALRSRGYKAVLFIAPGLVGGTMRRDGEPAWTPSDPLLDWDGLGQVVDAGWEIGSHSLGHANLAHLSVDRAEEELLRSRETLESRLGTAVRVCAYPYGAASERVEEIAARFYRGAFGTRLAFVTRRSHPMSLERIDAYYLRGRRLDRLDGLPLRAYLAVRRAGRAFRPIFGARRAVQVDGARAPPCANIGS